MVTSDSDTDFESADEELGRNKPLKKDSRITYWTSPTVDSESDDDAECVQHAPYKSSNWQRRKTARPSVTTGQKTLVDDKDDKVAGNVKGDDDVHMVESVETFNSQKDTSSIELRKSTRSTSALSVKGKNVEFMAEDSLVVKSDDIMPKIEAKVEKASEITQQRNSSHQLGTKKLAIRITKDGNNESTETQCLTECSNKRSSLSANKDTKCELQENNQSADDECKLTGINDLSEMDMPEELKSNKKFKEVFQPEGWEGLGNDIELPDELMEEKLEPVLEKLSMANKESESSLGNWSSWGNWGVTSLLNTATASVSTLTTQVSQGLTLLEDTIGIQDPRELAEIKQDETAVLDGTISSINFT